VASVGDLRREIVKGANNQLCARFFAVVVFLFFSGLACAEYPDAAAPAHPDLIIVRRFATPTRIVTLDSSLGFSLRRGQRGVPPARRAASVARATAFTLADTIAQQLRELGYDAVQSDEADPEPDGRGLIISGVFRGINEGHRRRFAAEDASVAASIEIASQTHGATPQRLTIFQLDSRQLPHPNGTHREPGVSSAVMRLAVMITHAVVELAHRSNWPGRRSDGG
jgi:hypothetical protein